MNLKRPVPLVPHASLPSPHENFWNVPSNEDTVSFWEAEINALQMLTANISTGAQKMTEQLSPSKSCHPVTQHLQMPAKSQVPISGLPGNIRQSRPSASLDIYSPGCISLTLVSRVLSGILREVSGGLPSLCSVLPVLTEC